VQTSQTKTIGGRDYTVSQLPAMKAVKVLHRIGKALGPALARAFAALGGKNAGANLLEIDLSGIDAGEFAEAIAGLFRDLPEAELEKLIRDLLETCTVTDEEGKTGLLMKTFDVSMQGRMQDLFALLAFAFEVNFGNFSAALAAFVPKRRAAPASPEPTT
jgi:hypothetical protein